ncbi:unnamed protein product [Rotaria socialis]|uniref:Chitin-binding type-4 domain-containing protein n=1 Tax=Rotaria socialis TaxID=392032 RepID=A0A821A488_9BILA|nr:unnamed protein product [Rotaria socialis]
MSTFTFSTTEKNKPLLICKGFAYTIDKTTNDKSYWKCEHVRTFKCNGRIHTNCTHTTLLHEDDNHNHPALNSSVATQNVIDYCLTNLSDHAAARLPDFYSSVCQLELCYWLIILISLQKIHGHGRMEDPPARNAAWRYGFDVPANYDDVGLNCGGLGVQSLNGGKCGICGDSYDGSRYHESGGKYATNIIVRHYLSGALIDVKILLSANHKGFMEFRLCPAVDANTEVTQECLDQNVLDIQGFGKQYSVSEGLDLIFLRVHLPPGLSCSRCVLQWRYHAGNNWGRNIQTGEACLGCGLQEEFYNCADISIAAVDNNFLLMPSTTMPSNHFFLLPFLNPVFLPRIHTPSPFIVYPTMMTSTDTTPTTTTKITEARQSFIFPFSPLKELIDQIDANNKTLRCYPTNEALKPLVGIENWCLQLCAINCPPTLCVCVKT